MSLPGPPAKRVWAFRLTFALGRMVERVQSPDLDLNRDRDFDPTPHRRQPWPKCWMRLPKPSANGCGTQGEVSTLTAEGRLSAIVLIVLAPALALLLHLRNPAYFQPLVETLAGRLDHRRRDNGAKSSVV